jgi:hypothetical protein
VGVGEALRVHTHGSQTLIRTSSDSSDHCFRTMGMNPKNLPDDHRGGRGLFLFLITAQSCS